MLGKLIKYEFRSSSRLMPITYLVVLILGVTASIVSSAKMLIFSSIAFGLLFLAGSAALIITYVVICLRFHKGVYGAEGYLAHTLPVDAKTLYLSKTIVSLVWMLIGIVITYVTWAIAYAMFFRMLISMQGADFPEDFFEVIRMFLDGKFITLMVFGVIIGSLAFLAEVFFCITLSNVRPFSKLGLGSAIIAYVALAFLTQILSLVFSLFIPVGLSFSLDSGWYFTSQTMYHWLRSTMDFANRNHEGLVMGLGAFILPVLYAVGLPFLTVWLMEKKVNVR